MEKLKGMKERIKRWNKEVFGDIMEVKRETLAKIERLDGKENSGQLEESEFL